MDFFHLLQSVNIFGSRKEDPFHYHRSSFSHLEGQSFPLSQDQIGSYDQSESMQQKNQKILILKKIWKFKHEEFLFASSPWNIAEQSIHWEIKQIWRQMSQIQYKYWDGNAVCKYEEGKTNSYSLQVLRRQEGQDLSGNNVQFIWKAAKTYMKSKRTGLSNLS